MPSPKPYWRHSFHHTVRLPGFSWFGKISYPVTLKRSIWTGRHCNICCIRISVSEVLCKSYMWLAQAQTTQTLARAARACIKDPVPQDHVADCRCFRPASILIDWVGGADAAGTLSVLHYLATTDLARPWRGIFKPGP